MAQIQFSHVFDKDLLQEVGIAADYLAELGLSRSSDLLRSFVAAKSAKVSEITTHNVALPHFNDGYVVHVERPTPSFTLEIKYEGMEAVQAIVEAIMPPPTRKPDNGNPNLP